MSIYPKHISNGENLIIHLRISNFSTSEEKIKYRLVVKNKNDEDIIKIEKSLILRAKFNNENEFKRQIYYSLPITSEMIPGKYYVDFYLIDKNGNIIQSETKDNDFFLVEQLKYYKINNTIYIENQSNETTEFLLTKGVDSYLSSVKGNEIIKLDMNYDYIQYANDFVDYIKRRD